MTKKNVKNESGLYFTIITFSILELKQLLLECETKTETAHSNKCTIRVWENPLHDNEIHFLLNVGSLNLTPVKERYL